jgi:hypothetical protein
MEQPHYEPSYRRTILLARNINGLPNIDDLELRMRDSRHRAARK